MTSKTREKLIEAAKQLFLRKGVENTTISDIAYASDKGRRTIYTYFKNKKEIYHAVIERESDSMVGALKAIVDSSMSPEEKLSNFISTRLQQAKSVSTPTSSRLLTSLDFGRSERVRKMACEKEAALLNSIMVEGVQKGVFSPQSAKDFSACTFPLLHAFDYINTDDIQAKGQEQTAQSFVNLILKAMKSF